MIITRISLDKQKFPKNTHLFTQNYRKYLNIVTKEQLQLFEKTYLIFFCRRKLLYVAHLNILPYRILKELNHLDNGLILMNMKNTFSKFDSKKFKLNEKIKVKGGALPTYWEHQQALIDAYVTRTAGKPNIGGVSADQSGEDTMPGMD